MDFYAAKKILNSKEDKYTDEQVKSVLELITLIAKSDVKQLMENEKGNPVHKSINR